MKVVSFNGSPRKNGNTEALLQETIRSVESAGHEVLKFSLNEMNIMPCQDCSGCEGTGVCVYQDDMATVTEAIRRSDRIILASPIFFFGLSAQAKAMIDRCQSFWCEKYLLKRPIPEGPNGRRGLLLLVGGMKNEVGVSCGEATAKAFFRTISIPSHETVSFLGIDAKGAIASHETAFNDVFSAGRRLVDAAEKERPKE
jgi:NAD(P)H-dependent FMN reductase